MNIDKSCCNKMDELRNTGIVTFHQQHGWCFSLEQIGYLNFYPINYCPFCGKKVNVNGKQEST